MEWEGRMIRLFTAGTRIALIAVAMAVSIPMSTFAQTSESAIESVPLEAEAEAVKTSPTGNENGTDKDTSVQIEQPVAVESEIQRRINELRSELLDDRADYIDRWLITVTIVLAFFGILGFKRFREIEAEARKSVEAAKRYETDAKDHAEHIEALQSKAVADVQRIQDLTAEVAAQNPAEAKQAIKDARENPKASLTDKAIADAFSLQRQGKRNDAIEKWKTIAEIAEESDNDLAARAKVSISFLFQENEDPEASLSVCDQAIRLKPDYAEAYNSRGNAKGMLGRYDDAIADFDKAIHLKPDYSEAYSNRGIEKDALGQHEAAIADFDEALRLKPDLGWAYNNRGNAKGKLGRHEAAIVDFDKAIHLKPDLAGAYGVGA